MIVELQTTTRKLLDVARQLRRKLPRRDKQWRKFRADYYRNELYKRDMRKAYLTGIVLQGGFW
jgi:hypothetical protein